MSDGYLTTSFGNEVLAEYFGTHTLYVALLASDPTISGLDGDEFSGGDYEREPTTWTAPSSKTCANALKLVFDNLEEGTVRWFGIFKTDVGMDMMAAKDLDTPIVIPASGRLVVPVHDIVITM